MKLKCQHLNRATRTKHDQNRTFIQVMLVNVSFNAQFYSYSKFTATLPDPMGNTGLKQRLIKEDNDLGLISSEYAPRLERTKSKVDSFEVSSTKHVPSPDSEWVS